MLSVPGSDHDRDGVNPCNPAQSKKGRPPSAPQRFRLGGKAYRSAWQRWADYPIVRVRATLVGSVGAIVALYRDPTTCSIEWDAAPGAISYIVYFGTAPSPGNDEREQDSTTFDVALMYDTTYYWRIDSKNDGGTTAGDVWSFTTVTQP